MSDDLLIKSTGFHDGGELVGNDPRKVTPEKLAANTACFSPIKAIRARCLDCCCGQTAEVRKCVATDCALWPFRMGVNPFHGRTKS